MGTDSAQTMRLLDAKVVSTFKTLSSNTGRLSPEMEKKLAAYVKFVAVK